jgi:hypothetical protein
MATLCEVLRNKIKKKEVYCDQSTVILSFLKRERERSVTIFCSNALLRERHERFIKDFDGFMSVFDRL